VKSDSESTCSSCAHRVLNWRSALGTSLPRPQGAKMNPQAQRLFSPGLGFGVRAASVQFNMKLVKISLKC